MAEKRCLSSNVLPAKTFQYDARNFGGRKELIDHHFHHHLHLLSVSKSVDSSAPLAMHMKNVHHISQNNAARKHKARLLKVDEYAEPRYAARLIDTAQTKVDSHLNLEPPTHFPRRVGPDRAKVDVSERYRKNHEVISRLRKEARTDVHETTLRHMTRRIASYTSPLDAANLRSVPLPRRTPVQHNPLLGATLARPKQKGQPLGRAKTAGRPASAPPRAKRPAMALS